MIGIIEPSLQLVGIVCMQETSSDDLRRLLVHLGLGGPRAQVPAAATLVVPLVLNGDFAEVTENVLHLGVGSGSGFTAQIVEPRDAIHQVVNNCNHNLAADD